MTRTSLPETATTAPVPPALLVLELGALPVRLARALRGAGHDVVDTSDLPRGNRSTNDEVCVAADEQERVVVTKE